MKEQTGLPPIDNIIAIRERFSHMGGHSGYDMLPLALEEMGVRICSIWPKAPSNRLFPRKLIERLSRCFIKGTPFYNQNNFWAEIQVYLSRSSPGRIIHILYGENNLGLLAAMPKRRRDRYVVTLHQPYTWWLETGMNVQSFFKNVDALIVLSSHEKQVLSEVLGDKVHFVPHGVDADFFLPMLPAQSEKKIEQTPQRCLVVGHWMRDFDTLFQVMDILLAKHSSLVFDLIVPDTSARATNVEERLAALVNSGQVTRHSGIDDHRLCSLYQEANLLLMPLHESTANNAILEAMGCGLPIVTNHTNGIPDYVDGTFTSLCPYRDVKGLVQAVEDIVSDPQRQREMGQAARAHAEKHFSWSRIGARVREVYAALDEN